MHTPKVIVVGAGPAGSSCAIMLAGAGLEVTMLERAKFPRYRPGETLHAGVEPLFETLGIANEINGGGYLRFPGVRVHDEDDPNEPRYEAFGSDERGEWLGYQIPRQQLDAILLRRAEQLGTQFIQEDAVSPIIRDNRVSGIATTTCSLTADFVVDATGNRHWLTRKLGLELTHRGPTRLVNYGYVEWDDASEFFIPLFRKRKAGWTWLAQVSEHRVAWVEFNRDPLPPSVPEELSHGRETGRIRGVNSTWRYAQQPAGDGWFATGDSAANVDPSSGHGVLKAIMGGMMVAHLINSTHAHRISQADAIEFYTRWLRESFQHDASRLAELASSS